MRRRKVLAALVERRLERGDQRDQAADRIVGALGIGDVTLPPADDQDAVERTAAPGLDGVAEHLDIARLAENAMIERFAALGRPVEQLDRAIDRHAFLIAGDQKRDRAARLAAIRRQMIERRLDKTGDAAFHVERAAAVEALAGNPAGKWRMRAGALVTWRNVVCMPGKQQVRLRFAD